MDLEAGETPATDVISPKAIQVLIFLDKRHRSITTAKEVWHAIAHLGGYLDRKSDGPLDGRPYGKDGCESWTSWRAIISPLFSILYDLCVSVSVLTRGGSAAISGASQGIEQSLY